MDPLAEGKYQWLACPHSLSRKDLLSVLSSFHFAWHFSVFLVYLQQQRLLLFSFILTLRRPSTSLAVLSRLKRLQERSLINLIVISEVVFPVLLRVDRIYDDDLGRAAGFMLLLLCGTQL